MTQRSYAAPPAPYQSANLAEILERILDKGIVIAGDIAIDLVDIELLTIKLRLLIASVDKAKEMGIDWWESDPALSSRARELRDENRELRERIDRLESMLEAGSGGDGQLEQPDRTAPERRSGLPS